MKIESVYAWRENLPLKKPYTIAYKTITNTELIFLKVVLQNGIIGYGAANPFPEVVGETAAMTLANLQSGFVHDFKGRDIRFFQQLIDETGMQFENRPGTLAAVDIALHDAFTKFLGISVLDFYGKKVDVLPTSITIGIKDIAEMLDEAKGYKALGFRVLKLKTGHRVEEDIERVHKIKEAFGNWFVIRVDANQGYSISELRSFIEATEGMVEVIEQPVKVGEDSLLCDLPSEVRTQLVADESLRKERDAFQLSYSPAPYGVFNIKLMKCGGIKSAKDIATVAKLAGIDLFWGCNDESIISIAAALLAAYSCSNTKYLDLDGSFDLSKDIVEGGFSLKDGLLYPTHQPGLGIVPIQHEP